MPRNSALALYLAKIEGVSGTDAVPTAAANAIAIAAPISPDYTTAFAPQRSHPAKGGTLNPDKPLPPAGRVYSWAKDVWLRGTGGIPSAGSPIEADPLLRSAGFDASYDPTPGAELVNYQLTAFAGIPTLTEYYYEDGLRYVGTGAAGDVSLAFDVGGPCVLSHSSEGRIVSVTDVALPVGTFSAIDPPIATDMPLFTVDSYVAGIARKFTLTLGNQRKRNDGVKAVGGVSSFWITQRAPRWSVVLEEPLIAAKDFRSRMEAGVDITIDWQIGAIQYNKIVFNTTRARIEKVTPSNDGGTALITLEGGLYGTGPLLLQVK